MNGWSEMEIFPGVASCLQGDGDHDGWDVDQQTSMPDYEYTSQVGQGQSNVSSRLSLTCSVTDKTLDFYHTTLGVISVS